MSQFARVGLKDPNFGGFVRSEGLITKPRVSFVETISLARGCRCPSLNCMRSYIDLRI